MQCPHCEARAIIRSSEAISTTVRELRYVCTDDLDCNFSWVAHMSIVHAVRPSNRPRDGVYIPLSAAFGTGATGQALVSQPRAAA
jgi:hypothetical protein